MDDDKLRDFGRFAEEVFRIARDEKKHECMCGDCRTCEKFADFQDEKWYTPLYERLLALRAHTVPPHESDTLETRILHLLLEMTADQYNAAKDIMFELLA